MDSPLTTQLRFGRFLEICGPGWPGRAGNLGVSLQERDALLAEFQGKLIRVTTPASVIVASLGAPAERTDAFLRYDLGVRTDLLFTFLLDEQRDWLVDSYYARAVDRALNLRFPRSDREATELTRELVALQATAPEVRASLGEPISRDGWWPFETWSYDHGLSLEMRLGVVE